LLQNYLSKIDSLIDLYIGEVKMSIDELELSFAPTS